MARMLNLNPNTPDEWPIDILDRLIEIQKNDGEQRLREEIRRLVSNGN